MTLTFPIEIQVNGRAKINNSSDGIKQFVRESLENVIGTFGFDRDFGSNIKNLDFTPNDIDYVEQRLYISVKNALDKIEEISFQDLVVIEIQNGVIKYQVTYFYQNATEYIEFVLK